MLIELLAESRLEAGLTQQQLAERLRRPQSFVAKYEGGERRIDVVEFIGIAKAINTDPTRLLQKLLKG
jgi:transcriptional regulator with XRE-family HTH domain